MKEKSYKIEKESDVKWRVRKEGDMRTDGVIYATAEMIDNIRGDASISQVANVATLPGIVGNSMAMPDVHEGYGFPIGGVAAFDLEEGIISPGGVGYDINCGVRMLATKLNSETIMPLRKALADALFSAVPSGVGSKSETKLSDKELNKVLLKGAQWAVENGFGSESDLECIEDRGRIEDADPDAVSQTAKTRGTAQLGTLGSGNHFVEIDFIDEVFDREIADFLGLYIGGIAVTVHTGSRGLGYQVCDDYIPKMLEEARKQNIKLPDRQLAAAPIRSSVGKRYLSAMASAANFAFANRQIISNLVAKAMEQTLHLSPRDIGMRLIYDVAHNIAKIEQHELEGGEKRKLCVHRKGATRAFPPGHPSLPQAYRHIGQPVLIPGDMGRHSYLLIGSDGAMRESFGSACHGAGRALSRNAAKDKTKGRAINRELEDAGIFVHSAGRHTLREEAPEAYKDVNQVVDVVNRAGLAKPIVRLRPLVVIKG
ncbi:MAG: RtcB family protein [Myxococcota bacterium]